MTTVIEDILEERKKQDAKWGEQNHDFPMWLAILTEELGEASQEFFTSQAMTRPRANFRTELVQCAAVLAAMIECGDRNSWF